MDKDLKKQLEMTPKTMAQLRKIGVKEEQLLKVEYFFYADKIEDARSLAAALKELDYEVDYALSADSCTTQYVITGITNRIVMNDDTMVNWTRKMWELGDMHQCTFDGWGTGPDMEEFQ